METYTNELKLLSYILSDLSDYLSRRRKFLKEQELALGDDCKEISDKLALLREDDDSSMDDYEPLEDEAISLTDMIAEANSKRMLLYRLNTYLSNHLDDIVSEVILLKNPKE